MCVGTCYYVKARIISVRGIFIFIPAEPLPFSINFAAIIMDKEPQIVFSSHTVLLDIAVQDKWELIRQMVGVLCAEGLLSPNPGITEQQVLDAVIQRENEMCTALGKGVALPHARIPGFQGVGMAVARLRNPITYNGKNEDHQVWLVVLLVVPFEEPQLVLKLMALAMRMVSDEAVTNLFRSVSDPELVADLVYDRVFRQDTLVLARDIMRPPLVEVRPDMPLPEVTRLMSEHMLESVAVTEPDGTLVGQITCDNLFKLGLPDFFSHLKSVSFIREFDPFENYFKKEAHYLARDVMTSDVATVPDDATLLEVIFELAVKSNPKVYVVRDGKRVGVIDRSTVLNRIINI